MFDFLFKKKEPKQELHIPFVYHKMKEIYCADEVSEDRKKYLDSLLSQYGYLPYSHIKTLEEISPAETFYCLEYKLKKEGVFDGEKFLGAKTSPVARRGIKNSDWIKKEGHDIKLINLAALGNGNRDRIAGKMLDWLKQLITLPVGVDERQILSTTIYLIPFTERNFGCAYLPMSEDVSHKLEDKNLKEKIGIDAKMQVQVFVGLAQLAGHPVIYDILPQTDRFAKKVLANPFLVRWFDIQEFTRKISNCVELVAKELERKYDKEDVEIIKDIYKQGGSGDLSEHYQELYNEFDNQILQLKKTNSTTMLQKANQVKIQKRVKEIVKQVLGIDKKNITEQDITKRDEIIRALINEGLWTAPGGAWCSAGVPVFDKMSDDGAYPEFKHFDYEGNDVSELANLDCQSPFYFAYLEDGSINQSVVDFCINTLKKLQNDFNFDGFRFDHVDHIVDELSQKSGKPISYRLPAKVLEQANNALKENIPYFACLAEYMLGGSYLKEYHKNMCFDILWGNDIPAQREKTPEVIMNDNQMLSNYNTKDFKIAPLSILKTYNNQDGEFIDINQYPAQLGKEGAMFKWFEYKFLPGGKFAQRPVMYVDGDESFTQNAIEKTIGSEVSMVRERDSEFYSQFDAINRFAKSQELVTEGEAQIITQDEDGFVCWLISKEPLKSSLMVVANYKPPIQKLTLTDELGKHIELIENDEVTEKRVYIPGDYKVVGEYVYSKPDYKLNDFEVKNNWIDFESIKPSEFRIFLLQK